MHDALDGPIFMPQNPYGTFDSTNNINDGTSRDMELIGMLGDSTIYSDNPMNAESENNPPFSHPATELGNPYSGYDASTDIRDAGTDFEADQHSPMSIVLSSNNGTQDNQPFYDLTTPSAVLMSFNRLFRKAFNQQDILRTLVLETRQLLKADRVVVYRLNEDFMGGVIVQEAVGPGFPQALGRHVEDPCFRDWYEKYYREGHVTSINNIYEANFARCYIEALERLEVKANLVAPLIEGDELFGLVVAHQCSRPREWQQNEIDLFTQIAMQTGVALERVSLSGQRQAEVKRAELQTNITRLLHRDGLDWSGVLKTSVVETKQALMADRVMIFRFNEDYLSGTIIQESVAPGLPQALNREIEDPCFKEWYVNYYQEGRITTINDIHKTDFAQCYIDALERISVKANIVAPIVADQQLFGLLVAHQCSRPREWQQAEIDLFSQIAIQTGVALDRVNLLDQRKVEAKKAKEQVGITKMLHKEALSLGDVLKTTVLETRQAIKADRVIILRFDENFSGVVTQESVAPGLPKALNKHIEDPCFKNEYAQHYKEGRVWTTSDVYRGNLTQCYVEALERLETKAVMVAPIVRDEALLGPQLYGLLIAHQCSGPRQWNQAEINLFTQVAFQTGFALERADLLESREADVNKAFAQTDMLLQMVRKPVGEEDILKEAVAEVRQILKPDRAMVLRFNDDWSAIVTQESVASGWPEAMYRRIEDPSFEEWYAQHYQEEGRVYAIGSTREASDYCIKALEQIGATAYLVAPITKGQKLLGLLIAQQLSVPQEWRQSAIDAFNQIAMRASFVLEQKEMKEQQEVLLKEKFDLLAQGERANEALAVVGISQEEMQKQREELQKQQEELIRQKQELMEQGEAARKALVAASLDQKTLREQREVLLKQRSALLKQRKELLERLNRGAERVEKDDSINVLEKLRRLWPPR
jgi:methyl-accepting chemotaxis protein PixJ